MSQICFCDVCSFLALETLTHSDAAVLEGNDLVVVPLLVANCAADNNVGRVYLGRIHLSHLSQPCG